jgi:hypothetical protein
MALVAGLPTIFQDREDVTAGGFASYGSANATPRGNEAALFMAGPDDEQVEAPTFLRGAVTRSPCRGVGSALPPPASLPAGVQLKGFRIVPSGIEVKFPVLFPRNGERDRVDF